MEIQISKNIFNKKYAPYLEDNRYLQIFFGGSSSGKSYFLAQRCIIDVLKGRNYLVCRQTYASMKDSIFNELCKAVINMGLSKLFTITVSPMKITCNNGCQVLFAGLDNEEKLKSKTPQKGILDTIWIEEATEIEFNSYKQLTKRLRGKTEKSKRIILSFNPIIKTHWIYKEFFKNYNELTRSLEEPDAFIVHSTYKDNRFLTKQDVEKLENETNEYYYDVYTLGNWGVLGNRIYENYKVVDMSEFNFPISASGIDFGFSNDPAVFIQVYFDRRENRIIVLNEIVSTGLSNKSFADHIKTIYKNEKILADSAEPKSIAELRTYGLNVNPVNKSGLIESGIRWLQGVEIIIDAKCINTIRQIQSYVWQKDKMGFNTLKPKDGNDDTLDALRYAISELIISKEPIFVGRR